MDRNGWYDSLRRFVLPSNLAISDLVEPIFMERV